MGNDNVLSCIVSNSIRIVAQMYNSGRSAPSYLNSSMPSDGISDQSISYENGDLTCSFLRQNENPSVTNYFSSSATTYYLLLARGSVSSGSMQIHSYSSSSLSKVNLNTNGNYSGSLGGAMTIKTKLHGRNFITRIFICCKSWFFAASTFLNKKTLKIKVA